MFTHYTVKSANQALPDIIQKYRYALRCGMDVSKAGKNLENLTEDDFQSYIEAKQNLNSKIVKYYSAISALEDTGVIIKDMEQGLLDFPSRRFDDEIWLCWKSGESEIKFWHEKDSGFNGRKPIQTSDESLV